MGQSSLPSSGVGGPLYSPLSSGIGGGGGGGLGRPIGGLDNPVKAQPPGAGLPGAPSMYRPGKSPGLPDAGRPGAPMPGQNNIAPFFRPPISGGRPGGRLGRAPFVTPGPPTPRTIPTDRTPRPVGQPWIVPFLVPKPHTPEQYRDPTGRMAPSPRERGPNIPITSAKGYPFGHTYDIFGYFHSLIENWGDDGVYLSGFFGNNVEIKYEYRNSHRPFYFNPDIVYDYWTGYLDINGVKTGAWFLTTLHPNEPSIAITAIVCKTCDPSVKLPELKNLPESPPFLTTSPVAPPKFIPETEPETTPLENPVIPSPFLPPGFEPYQPFPIPAYPPDPPLDPDEDEPPPGHCVTKR